MPSAESENRREENEKYLSTVQVKFLLIITNICLGSFSYIPGSTLMNLGKKISEDMFHMPSVFVCRAAGFIVGIIFGTYAFEEIRQLKQKYLVFFVSMLLLSLMSLAISFVTNLLGLILPFCASGICMATLVAGVDAICLFSKEDMGIPFYQTLSVFYAIGSVFAPVSSRNHHRDKLELNFPRTTIHVDTVSYVYSIFAGGAFIVSLLWLLQYCFSAFKPPVVSELDRKSEVICPVLKYLIIFNTSILFFLGLTINFSYVLLLPTYCTFMQDMSENESSDFMTLFLGLSVLGRLLSILTSDRIDPSKAVLIGISLVLFAVVIMYVKLDFVGEHFWSGNSFIGFGSGPMISSLFAWFSQELKITPRIVLILHIFGALSELVVPMVLSFYLWEDDHNRSNRNGFLLSVALMYLFFLFFQYVLLQALRKTRTVAGAPPRTFREVALSDMSLAERTFSSERFTFGAGLQASEDEGETQKANTPVATHENVIQRLSEVKSRIKIQNRSIKSTFQTLTYSVSQLK